MDHTDQPAADLSRQERLCLLLIGDTGLEAFNVRDDEVLASLLGMGLIDAKPFGGETSLLSLTESGRIIAARLRDNMG